MESCKYWLFEVVCTCEIAFVDAASLENVLAASKKNLDKTIMSMQVNKWTLEKQQYFRLFQKESL